ncbi:hypothetical protein SRABI26_00739 [Arthrobacter sp. Bi26]|nr:hypothetical protein SRABI26_00739 [Arthrobacter sp. Bi26]
MEDIVLCDDDAVDGGAEDSEEDQDHERAHQSEFLADDREDEVVVRFRDPAVLLPALAQSDAEPSAGREPVQTVGGLVVQVGAIGTGLARP